MADLKPSTMRPYFAALSRARRASRALAAKHGPTRVFGDPTFEQCPAVPRKAPQRSPLPGATLDKPKATSNRDRGRKGHAPVSVLHQLEFAQGGRCYLCGEAWDRDHPLLKPTHDHVVPVYHGGKRARNLCGAHKVCNEGKANRWPFPCERIYLAAVNAIRAAHFGC